MAYPIKTPFIQLYQIFSVFPMAVYGVLKSLESPSDSYDRGEFRSW